MVAVVFNDPDVHSLEVVDEYIRDVLNDRIPTCELTKLAVQRHVDDLETAEDRGFFFSERHALMILNWFRLLVHTKGKWAGAAFILSPWQQFFLAVLFGWRRLSDGKRRFRTSYLEVPRKNGKTTIHAGLALYMLVADGEAGAEVYSAATKKDQAKITFTAAKDIVQKTPWLKKRIIQSANNLCLLETSSKFEPLGADSDTVDGLNVSCGLIDELHAHKTRGMWDVIDSAIGSREQPLISTITTAGFFLNGICKEQRDYLEKILRGFIVDDFYFGIVYTIDPQDDWKTETAWRKANPNYGVSVLPDDISRACQQAINVPGLQTNFLTKRLDVWCSAESRWADLEAWQECGAEFDLDKLRDVPCYAGLDLASVSDLAALMLVWETDDVVYSYGRYYCPEAQIKAKAERGNSSYKQWQKAGWLVGTPGNVTDYAFIEHDIKELRERFDIRGIAFDRWNSSQLVNDLVDDGAPMISFGQGFASMSAPMKALERIVSNRSLNHGNDPVLLWCASNVIARVDPAGNQKPDKGKSKEKIDAVTALIMAVGLSLAKTKDKTYQIFVV